MPPFAETESTVTRDPIDEPLSARHFLAADGVRGVAILIVVVHNSAFVERSSPSFLLKLTSAVTATGWVGVELFFVLSGFLITGILIDALGSPRYFRNFYIRRTLRIFPLYYAVLAFSLFVFPHIANVPEWSTRARENQWWYWSYLANWGDALGHGIAGFPHFWSLAVEEQFYLVWPLLVFALSRRSAIRLTATIVATTPLIRLFLHLRGLPAQAGYEFTIARWDALAAGALLALLIREETGKSRLAQRMGPVTVMLAGALALVTLYERGFHSDDVLVQVGGQTLIALLSTSLVYYCVAPPNGAAAHVQRVMSVGWLRFFGKYSYAIYVFHFPIQLALSHCAADKVNAGDATTRFVKLVLYLGCALGLSTLAAMVSWRVLENPCLALKNRFAPRTGIRAPTNGSPQA
jgi:peptidoglycan/LPS O-acetylase OafA/YrhL